ncbi:MAG: tryptophan halogenase family protein [Bacteroidota bacterium]
MHTSKINQESKPVRKLIVLGGGSAGWMSAAFLNHALGKQVQVCLVESPTIGRIGVGEATLPTIKEDFFDFLGIPESEWMPACKATFKMGIKFMNWLKSPEEGGDKYYHCFGEIPSIGEVPLSHILYKKWAEEGGVALDKSCYTSPHYCERHLAPKMSDGRKVEHYAYHIDAQLVADFLRDRSVERGVEHIYDNIVHVHLNEEGNIGWLVGENGDKYEAEMYVDCTGFTGALLGKALGEPWIDFNDTLLTDSAVAINIPGNPKAEQIRPYTSATGMKHGWLWETPLFGRTGNGYVYSSQFVSQEDAEAELRQHFGERAEGRDVRHIRFRTGRRRRSWVKNCVGIGLASSFLEPLESTGLYFVYAALHQFIRHFPSGDVNPVHRKAFNERVSYMVEDVKDFIIMHFITAGRKDTPFWRAAKEVKIPDSLQEILDKQKAGLPIKMSYHGNKSLYSTFESSFDRFWTNSNYQAVLAGVNYLPDEILPILNLRPDLMQKGELQLEKIRKEVRHRLASLPTHYDFLKGIHQPKEVEQVS